MKKRNYKEDRLLGTKEWKTAMQSAGKTLKNNKVRLITFVHGTFAGDDAFGLLSAFEPMRQVFPQANPILKKIKEYSKQSVNYLADDVGNFSPEYVKIFQKEVSETLCDLFVWSGGNYHFARLTGVVNLIHTLAENIKKHNIKKDEKILLLGHSHAGQLFALLTLFLEDKKTAKGLYAAVESSKDLQRELLLDDLLIIDNIHLDFVTFGMPSRYKWGEYSHYRLLSIINHRSLIKITGLLETKDGDYIQQWGTEGSDIMPPPNLITINDSLDKFLDRGRHISSFIKRLQLKRRILPKKTDGKPAGTTLLVDYQDQKSDAHLFTGKSSPFHSIKTQFGHGVYTLKNAMLFNINLIIDEFYS